MSSEILTALPEGVSSETALSFTKTPKMRKIESSAIRKLREVLK